MTTEGGGLSATVVAVALVAAARRVGIMPDLVFTNRRGAPKARVLAAAGCIARLGVRPIDAARLFRLRGVSPTAPCKLRQWGIGTDDLLEIAEALDRAGLTGGVAAPPRPPAPAGPVSASGKSGVLETSEGRAARPAHAGPRAPRPGRVVRLKPLTPRVVRWAGWFPRSRWTIAEVADLFDVDPAELAVALFEPGREAAA